MKQFPYAQQIIWENDVGQIEWIEEVEGVVWFSGYYIAKTPSGSYLCGWWKLGACCATVFQSYDADYNVCELECWAKL